MTTQPARTDLIVLVADIQQEKTIATLLDARAESLRIRKPTYEIYPHSERDPGVYKNAGNFLNVFVNQFRYALVFLDAAWDGSPASAGEIAFKIQSDLDQKGWASRSAVIVFDPELELWVWSDSPHVPTILGTDWKTIRALAQERNCWRAEDAKPSQPKELLEDVLHHANKHRSAALFAQLAHDVSLERCQDPAFAKFRAALRQWFPSDDAARSATRRVRPKRRKPR